MTVIIIAVYSNTGDWNNGLRNMCLIFSSSAGNYKSCCHNIITSNEDKVGMEGSKST